MSVLFTIVLVGVIVYLAFRSALKENSKQIWSQAPAESFSTSDALKAASECHKRLPSLIEVLGTVAEQRVGSHWTSQIAELTGKMESQSSKFPPPIVTLTLTSVLASQQEKIKGSSMASDIQQHVTGLGRMLVNLLREEGYPKNAVLAQTTQLSEELLSAAKGFDPIIFDLTITIALDKYAEHLTRGIANSSRELSGHLNTAGYPDPNKDIINNGKPQFEPVGNQVPINELARELEVKGKAIIDLLPGFGVTEKKTHSSSITVEVAEKVRHQLASRQREACVTNTAHRNIRAQDSVSSLGDLSGCDAKKLTEELREQSARLKNDVVAQEAALDQPNHLFFYSAVDPNGVTRFFDLMKNSDGFSVAETAVGATKLGQCVETAYEAPGGGTHHVHRLYGKIRTSTARQAMHEFAKLTGLRQVTEIAETRTQREALPTWEFIMGSIISSGQSSGHLSTADSAVLQAVSLNAAEPSKLGSMLGRECVKNGLALGQTLFLGHGTRPGSSTVQVFESDDHMKLADFTPYCTDLRHKPPMEDQSELSRHARAAGIGFAFYCVIIFAQSFKKESNQESFIRSVAQTMRAELGELDTGITMELVLHYNRTPLNASLVKRPLLKIENPGTDDILAVMLEEVNKQVQGRALGFQKRGPLGFETIAISLTEETGRRILPLVNKFGW